MGRRRSKKTKAAAAAASASKKVCVSFHIYGEAPRWIEIDPHYKEEEEDCFAVDPMPKLNSPPSHLDLSNLTWYATTVFHSTLFFIGGKIPYHDDRHLSPEVLSDKLFTYHLFSHKWEESPCRLNIARTSPVVAVFDDYMYVFGGYMCVNGKRTQINIANKEHWIERHCLLTKNDDAKLFEFLPHASAPPDPLVKDYVPMYHFLYGTQIYFRTATGCYAFDFISNTWGAPFNHNTIITALPYVRCAKVVVIDHLLFCHYFGVIYVYDLINHRLVLSQHLNQLKMSFPEAPEPRFRHGYPDNSFLERIAKDTLLLVVQDGNSDDEDKVLHCYKFQIQNDDPDNLRLLQIGCGFFPSPSCYLLEAVSV